MPLARKVRTAIAGIGGDVGPANAMRQYKAGGSLFTDVAATDPVDTTGDLIRFITDETGLGRDVTQAAGTLAFHWSSIIPSMTCSNDHMSNVGGGGGLHNGGTLALAFDGTTAFDSIYAEWDSGGTDFIKIRCQNTVISVQIFTIGFASSTFTIPCSNPVIAFFVFDTGAQTVHGYQYTGGALVDKTSKSIAQSFTNLDSCTLGADNVDSDPWTGSLYEIWTSSDLKDTTELAAEGAILSATYGIP